LNAATEILGFVPGQLIRSAAMVVPEAAAWERGEW